MQYKKPDFMIIGAMKCATSTLHEQLNQQSGLFLTEPKEPNFFSNDDIYSQGFDWYSNLYSDAKPNDLLGESSTHYTKLPTYPKTIERIQKYGISDLKLIYVVRHPIDRLVSQYIHEWSQGFLSDPINDALDTFPELIAYSKYSEQIKPFIDAFGAQNIRVHTFKTMMARKQDVLSDVCKFIGYPGKPIWRENQDHSNKSSERIKKFPGYELFVESALMTAIRQRLIPKSVRNRVRNSLTMKKRPELTEQNILRLKDVFDRDLKEFGSMLNVELNTDNFNKVDSLDEFSWSDHAFNRREL